MKKEVLNIDYPKLAVLLTPIPLRKPFFVGLLTVCMFVMTEIKDCLLKYWDEVTERLKYNGQVCRLEYALNCILNADAKEGEPRITVEDAQPFTEYPFYLYKRGTVETFEMPIHWNIPGNHIILNCRRLNAPKHIDFIVNAPPQIALEIERLRLVTDTYKLQSKLYKITRENR
ncbi:MAG: hypothetical protein K5685_04540 [Bacteroidales bacterium]|nr:hypothetical protein [Bacteroidales bacterium]